MQVRPTSLWPRVVCLCTASWCAGAAIAQAPPAPGITPQDVTAIDAGASPAPASRLLAREPQTPEETFDAAVTMLQLARPELSRQYLQAFLNQAPDDALLLALRDKYGTPTLVRMSQTPELQPAGTELLTRVNAAALNQLNDPGFQQSLLQSLMGNQREHDGAVSTLHSFGSQAAVILIGKLAAGSTEEEQEQIAATLVALGDPMVAPLHAALAAPITRVQFTAIDALGRIRSQASASHLLAAGFDAQATPALRDAVRVAVARILYNSSLQAQQVTGFRVGEQLLELAASRFRQHLERDMEEDGLYAVWTWDTAASNVREFRVPATSVALYEGEQWARSALAVAPENDNARTMLLGFQMWRDLQASGWQAIPEGPGTAHDLALALGPAMAIRTLELGLDAGNAAATLTSLRVLSQTGSRTSLLVQDSPLMRAVESADPRVQFAAACTVLELDPEKPFAGATRIVDILARTLAGGTRSASVVIDPNTVRGSTFATTLSELGYEPSLARTGQDGFELAASRGNVVLAAVHLNSIRWDLTQTVANLRADSRTASVPILVYGPPDWRYATERKLQHYRQIGYVPELPDPGAVRHELQPLLSRLTSPPLTPEQRQEQIATAAYWLRHIAEGHHTDVFPLEPVEDSLSAATQGDPPIATDALIALGAIGKPSVQRRLLEVGLGAGYDPAVREVAVQQLAFHIQRFGRLIENADARQVDDAWRAAAQEPRLSSAWAAVVGALGSNAAAMTPRLLQQPLPAPLP